MGILGYGASSLNDARLTFMLFQDGKNQIGQLSMDSFTAAQDCLEPILASRETEERIHLIALKLLVGLRQREVGSMKV